MSPYTTRFIAREHAGLIELANRGLDSFGILVAAIFATLGLENSPQLETQLSRDWILLVLVCILSNLLIFQYAGLYKSWRGRPFSDQLGRLILAGVGANLVNLTIWSGFGFDTQISKEFVIFWLSLSLVLISVQRAIFQVSIRHLRRKGINTKHTVIYGAGSLGQAIAEQVRLSPETGYRIVAFVDDDPSIAGHVRSGLTVIGDLRSLEQWLQHNEIDEIWVALPLHAAHKITSVLESADPYMISVRMFPDLNGLTLLNHSVTEMLGLPIIDLNVDQMHGINRFVKGLEDRVLGFLFFFLSLPLIVIIAMMIRLDSPGPVIFRQRRNGWDGEPFTIYKFRTMYLHEERDGQLTQAKRDDYRFTPIGRWLRRTSLDELPQLFNVLQGKMSLVGPRPHAIEHNSFFQQRISGYMRRHRVKPGITGWAQINDLRGEIIEIEQMTRRLKHDLYYIEHWSLMFDLRIIMATLLKIFFSKKAW